MSDKTEYGRSKQSSGFYRCTHPSVDFYKGLTPEEIAFVNQPVVYLGDDPAESLQDIDVLYQHRHPVRV